MKNKKNFKCDLCDKNLEITEIDKAENIAWFSCPEFMAGNDEHTSFSAKLTRKIEEEFIKA